MTVREVYEALLIELSRVEAPNILLEDFIYYLNKAINQKVNKNYSNFETTQQSTDDLKFLITKRPLSYTDRDEYFRVEIPKNYLHLLSITCNYVVKEGGYKCFKAGKTFSYPAKKATADSWPMIAQNYYMCPKPERPYYKFSEDNTIEVYCGDLDNLELTNVTIEYIREPEKVELTLDDLNNTETDDSQILEFPDYVCREIINELISLVMANQADERLAVYPQVNQSIAAHQQTS